MKTLLFLMLAAEPIPMEPIYCVKATVTSFSQVILQNNCNTAVNIWVPFKFYDKDGYRLNSNDGSSLTDFAPGEKARLVPELRRDAASVKVGQILRYTR